MVRWQAIVHWLTLVLTLAGLLILGDALLQREEFGLRILSLVILIVASCLAAYRILRPAWRFHPTSTHVASWVEEQDPSLGDRLSNVIQLANLETANHRFGSPQFREFAYQQWLDTGYPLRWSDYLDSSPWWKSVGRLGCVVVALAACYAIWPQPSWTGLQRLVPFSSATWPRSDRLQLVDPPKTVARDNSTQIEIIDLNPPLPDRIDLLIRDAIAPDGGSSRELLVEAVPMGDVAVANLPAINAPTEIRAVGGDDDSMPWHRIDVVIPPQLEEFRFSVTTPEYIGLETREIVGKRIQVLAGSQIRLSGKLSEPIAALRIKLIDSPADAPPTDSPQWFPTLGVGGKNFSVDNTGERFVASDTLSWQFAVVTIDDLEIVLPDVWSIDVVQDAVPVVTFEGSTLRSLATQGKLTLKGQASDDQGLVRIVARAKRPTVAQTDFDSDTQGVSGEASEAELELWSAAPTQAPPAGKAQNSSVQNREINVLQAWAIHEGLPIRENDTIEVWLEATDNLGQVGRSRPQSFRVETPQGVLETLAERQRKLTERVRELVDSQRRNLQLAERTTEVATASNRIEQETVDALSGVSQVESTIGRQLAEGSQSIAGELSAIAQALQQNQLADSSLAQELSSLERTLTSTLQDKLPEAVKATANAYQAARPSQALEKLSNDTKLAMQASVTSQAELLAAMQTWLDQASQAEALQQAQQQLSQLLNQQQRLMQETEQLHLEEVSGANASELLKERTGLSAEMQGMARQVDELVGRLRSSAEAETAGAKQDRISGAADALVEEQASRLMRQAADQISKQDLTASSTTQKSIEKAIESALDQLGFDRPVESNLADRASRLREASRAISDLAQQQAELAQDMRSSRQSSSDLSQRQLQLEDSTRLQAAQLESSNQPAASQSLENVLDEQRSSRQSLANNNPSDAGNAAQAAAEQLAETAQDLQERSDLLNNAAQQEQIFRLANALNELVELQTPIVAELENLTPSLDDNAQLLKAQQQELRRLASDQEAVRKKLDTARTRTDRLPAFDWTLEQTNADMLRSVAAAQRFRLAPDAIEAAQAALRKLTLIAQAVATEDANPSETQSSDASNEDTNQNPSQQARLLPPVASLKLLLALQSEINEQTKRYDVSKSSAEFSSAGRQTQMLDELIQQQAALAVQLEKLLQEFQSAGPSGGESRQQPDSSNF